MAKPQVISLNPVYLYDGVSGSLPPPFNDVLWRVNCFCSLTHVYVIYAGTSEALIAAGCATQEMIAPYQHGQRVRDADGDSVKREFRKGWLRLERTRPIARALQLPGVTIDAIRVAKKKFSASRLDDLYPDLSAYERPRPQLRLVINNNTRETENG
jgi:hypothetical protein